MEWLKIAFPIALIVIGVIITKAVYIRNALKEAQDFYQAIRDAVTPDEDGKIRLTSKELSNIFKEGEDFAQASAVLFGQLAKK